MRKKIDILLSESINDIALEKYQEFFSIYDKDADKDFINRKSLEIFYGIDSKYYNNMKIKDIDVIITNLNTALDQKIPLITRFNLNNIEYGFIPNLDDIEFSEFADLDNNGGMDKMHRLMSILFRPVIEEEKDTYLIEQYKGTNDNLKKMPLGIALSALDFFFDIGIQLTSATLNSLTPKTELQKRKLVLAKNGLGILQSTRYRMGISMNLISQSA